MALSPLTVSPVKTTSPLHSPFTQVVVLLSSVRLFLKIFQSYISSCGSSANGSRRQAIRYIVSLLTIATNCSHVLHLVLMYIIVWVVNYHPFNLLFFGRFANDWAFRKPKYVVFCRFYVCLSHSWSYCCFYSLSSRCFLLFVFIGL